MRISQNSYTHAVQNCISPKVVWVSNIPLIVALLTYLRSLNTSTQPTLTLHARGVQHRLTGFPDIVTTRSSGRTDMGLRDLTTYFHWPKMILRIHEYRRIGTKKSDVLSFPLIYIHSSKWYCHGLLVKVWCLYADTAVWLYNLVTGCGVWRYWAWNQRIIWKHRRRERGNQSIVSMAGYNKTCISQNLVKLQTNLTPGTAALSCLKQSANDQVR